MFADYAEARRIDSDLVFLLFLLIYSILECFVQVSVWFARNGSYLAEGYQKRLEKNVKSDII